MQAAWIDRAGGLYDALGSSPDVVASTLVELATTLEKMRSWATTRDPGRDESRPYSGRAPQADS
jgi:hypothetical protein